MSWYSTANFNWPGLQGFMVLAYENLGRCFFCCHRLLSGTVVFLQFSGTLTLIPTFVLARGSEPLHPSPTPSERYLVLCTSRPFSCPVFALPLVLAIGFVNPHFYDQGPWLFGQAQVSYFCLLLCRRRSADGLPVGSFVLLFFGFAALGQSHVL